MSDYKLNTDTPSVEAIKAFYKDIRDLTRYEHAEYLSLNYRILFAERAVLLAVLKTLDNNAHIESSEPLTLVTQKVEAACPLNLNERHWVSLQVRARRNDVDYDALRYLRDSPVYLNENYYSPNDLFYITILSLDELSRQLIANSDVRFNAFLYDLTLLFKARVGKNKIIIEWDKILDLIESDQNFKYVLEQEIKSKKEQDTVTTESDIRKKIKHNLAQRIRRWRHERNKQSLPLSLYVEHKAYN